MDAAPGGRRRGRVFNAASVFLTFPRSGPMRPKQMGIILGFAVLRDPLLVRLMLVPILLRSTGRAAGWLPTSLDQLLALMGPVGWRAI